MIVAHVTTRTPPRRNSLTRSFDEARPQPSFRTKSRWPHDMHMHMCMHMFPHANRYLLRPSLLAPPYERGQSLDVLITLAH